MSTYQQNYNECRKANEKNKTNPEETNHQTDMDMLQMWELKDREVKITVIKHAKSSNGQGSEIF